MSIRNKALDLLARREHSRTELRNKLLHRFRNEEQSIDTVLDKLENENLLSDQRFTEMYIRGRVAKSIGPIRIISELRQKGVDASLAELVLADLGVEWCAALKALSFQKYGETVAQDDKERAKRIRFFQYKGYSPELIREVVSW
ncbi:recombination regulator RecX [Aurantivibrio plasticivorans]